MSGIYLSYTHILTFLQVPDGAAACQCACLSICPRFTIFSEVQVGTLPAHVKNEYGGPLDTRTRTRIPAGTRTRIRRPESESAIFIFD